MCLISRLQAAERQRRSDKSQEASTPDVNSNNGNHNVSFEGLDNSGFSRESIQRFTVNPMFATSERDSEEDLVIADDAMYLPASHMMYLPSNEGRLRSNLILDLCFFVPCFPAFFDLLISLGQ